MLGAMQKSDFVLCRAGLGSITELNYLQKPTFLVPIPNSHQELNAYLSPQFVTLDQNQSNFWLGQIQTLKAKAKFLEQNPIRQQAYYTRFKEICSQK
jgi:UDP-N-acetylglucosamine:LPS N-acetylglucosamine transferase